MQIGRTWPKRRATRRLSDNLRAYTDQGFQPRKGSPVQGTLLGVCSSVVLDHRPVIAEFRKINGLDGK
jgi:hypothetical protein